MTPTHNPITRLPVPALLVMTLATFALVGTETMPAGVLPQIANALDTSEGVAGQFMSAFALGTVVLAVPAAAITRGYRRKPIFILGMLGFVIANTITALSPLLALSLGARFLGGACAGLVWGMLAGYARKISPPNQAGRSLAISQAGTPLGLALGTPLGAWLGANVDWRWAFGTMSIALVGAIVLALIVVPDAAGQHATTQMRLRSIIVIPGVLGILSVIIVWMLGHNILYTYIAPYLRNGSTGVTADVALLVFGIAAVAGIVVTGFAIDRALRRLVLGGISLFVIAGTLLVASSDSTTAVLVALVLWGLAFGGAAAQLQTALSRAAGENADVANSLLAVSFNVAIFGGGILGAVIIGGFDALVLPAAMVVFAAAAVLMVFVMRRSAFPA